MAGMEIEHKKDRTMLWVRILLTLLILAMIMPGWGILSASTLVEQPPSVASDTIRPTNALTTDAMSQDSMSRDAMRTVSTFAR